MKIVLLFVLVNLFTVYAQDNERSFELSSYGILTYKHFDYGPNQKATPQGSKDDNRSIIDISKFILEPKFNFSKDLYIEAEIEFEHLGTGSALELEYEEFGEYEFESEKGGEVQLEELYIGKLFSDEFNVRIGRFPIPLTLYTRAHKPTNFFSTAFPESETMIIPSVWYETGIEVFGKYKNFNYRAAVVNGLDATGFSSENWVAQGYQTKFEEIKATNLAIVGRIDYAGINNLLIGGAVYFGNSAGNRPKPEDMEGIDADVTIFSAHVQYVSNPFIFRANYIHGSLQNSDIVSQRNSRLSVNIQTPRSPVAKNAVAYYAEGGYNILPLLSNTNDYKLYPFLRYEYYNTMEAVTSGIFANPRFKRSIITGGLNLNWNDEIVVKLDYSSREVGEGKYNTENTIGFGIGFNTTFFKL